MSQEQIELAAACKEFSGCFLPRLGSAQIRSVHLPQIKFLNSRTYKLQHLAGTQNICSLLHLQRRRSAIPKYSRGRSKYTQYWVQCHSSELSWQIANAQINSWRLCTKLQVLCIFMCRDFWMLVPSCRVADAGCSAEVYCEQWKSGQNADITISPLRFSFFTVLLEAARITLQALVAVRN